MVWWSSAGKWAKKEIQAFFRRAWRSPSLRPVGELEGTGNRLGTTSCSALEPSLRPSSSLGPGLEEQWTSPPSLSLQPTSSGHFPGPQSLRTGLLTWTPVETGPVGLGAWLHQGWELCRMWAPCSEGAAKWDLFLLIQDGTLQGEICALKLCLLLTVQERQKITFIW